MFVRKVNTASGATAVQIARREGRRDVVVEHLGSAHNDAELVVLMQAARAKLHEGQDELDLGMMPVAAEDRVGIIESQTSQVLIEVISAGWRTLGFDIIDDEAFFQLVLARIVEPTSIREAVRVLGELGVAPAHRNTFTATLRRCASLDYRGQIAIACFNHALTSNLKDLDEAGLRFIVGSRVTKAPKDLESYFRWHGDLFADGQIIDTITPRDQRGAAVKISDPAKRAEPVWDPAVHTKSWRAVWAYS